MTEFLKAADLPPYDESVTCPMCCGGMTTTYHGWMDVELDKKHRPVWPCFTGVPVADSHLCRVCERCGYGWCEATAEAREPGKVTKRSGNVRALREGK